MKLNKEKLHKDILIKLKEENKTKISLCKYLRISNQVIVGLSIDNDIRISNFLKLINWLDNGELYLDK